MQFGAIVLSSANPYLHLNADPGASFFLFVIDLNPEIKNPPCCKRWVFRKCFFSNQLPTNAALRDTTTANAAERIVAEISVKAFMSSGIAVRTKYCSAKIVKQSDVERTLAASWRALAPSMP